MKFYVEYNKCNYCVVISNVNIQESVDREFRNVTYTLVSYELDRVIDYKGLPVDTFADALLELIEERILDEYVRKYFQAL
jgi:hypothetical protein